MYSSILDSTCYAFEVFVGVCTDVYDTYALPTIDIVYMSTRS